MKPADLGRQLWSELHAFAWEYPREATAEDQRRAREWLAEWARRVPNFGCGCRRKWLAMVAICPPPLDGAETLYWWTVAAHDRVNRELGKPLAAPEWSLQHALLLSP